MTTEHPHTVTFPLLTETNDGYIHTYPYFTCHADKTADCRQTDDGLCRFLKPQREDDLDLYRHFTLPDGSPDGDTGLHPGPVRFAIEPGNTGIYWSYL